MKQLNFELLLEELTEPPIPLDQRTQEELVTGMAAAIIAVHKKGGGKTDEQSSGQ